MSIRQNYGQSSSKPSQPIGDHPVWTWPIPHEHSFIRLDLQHGPGTAAVMYGDAGGV